MAAESVPHARPEIVTSEERWAAWVARGVEHDRRLKKRAIAIAAVAAAGAALSLLIVLLR